MRPFSVFPHPIHEGVVPTYVGTALSQKVKIMQFEAAVFVEPKQPLEIETVKLARLGPYDVLVRMEAAGLCHTDWEAQQGSLPVPAPMILGHEGAGIVEDIGAEVTQVRPGQKVVCTIHPACGQCYYCRRGQPMLCEPMLSSHHNGTLLDGNTRLEWGGKPLHQFMNVGSFGEYAVVPERGAVPIPEAVPSDRACILACAVITGVGAVTRVAKVEYGARVAIVGCGPVGLNVVQGAAQVGAETIIAVDTAAERLAFAEKLGATHVVNAAECDAAKQVRRLTGGRGADYVFEAAGSEVGFQSALDAARPGGTVVLLGKVDAQRKVSLRFGSLMGEKHIIRSSLGGSCAHDDYPAYAQSYLSGKLELDAFITARMPLQEINRGMDRLARGEMIRGVVIYTR